MAQFPIDYAQSWAIYKKKSNINFDAFLAHKLQVKQLAWLST
jgi:hypothetical protein